MEQLPDNSVSPVHSRSKNYLVWGLFLLAGLLVGAAFGYRAGQAQRDPVQVVVTATPGPAVQTGVPSAETPTDKEPARTKSPMDVVLADARHFQGSPEAPVTMIEFSDFK
jgi:protein-disulfide isomerase